MRFFYILLTLVLAHSHVCLGDQTSPYRLKGQGQFYQNFETMDVDRWLSKNHWLKTLEFTEEEKREEIERNYREEIGRVITCIGSCRLHRDSGFYDLSYRSLVVEGDTLETGVDSYLWIALKNGNLMRMSALTKLQLIEINSSQKRIKLTLSLVHGFIHNMDRSDDPATIDDGFIDTDSIIFPLRYKEANLEYYYYLAHQKKQKRKGAQEISVRAELFDKYLIQKANADQMLMGKLKREYFIHTADGDIISEDASFMMSYQSQTGAYWYHGYNDGVVAPAVAQMRQSVAYEETLAPRTWYVIKSGTLSINEKLANEFVSEAYLTKRMTALRLTRDYFFHSYFFDFYKTLQAGKRKAVAKLGARMWSEEELNARDAHIKKYFHFMGRLELKNLLKQKKMPLGVPSKYLNSAASKHLIATLQASELNDPPILKELNEVQFHFWLFSQMAGSWYPKGVLNP